MRRDAGCCRCGAERDTSTTEVSGSVRVMGDTVHLLSEYGEEFFVRR